ncbi:MAG: protein-disulfide reductase DsbD domain-containing protein [Methylococcales bacterium]|nr:thiol:disulfide interchange protein [Methylococcaceae bacterium]
MLVLRLLSVTFCWLALYCSEVQANASIAATEQVTAQLIASVNAVLPGDEILVGVNQKIIPHWHTYWRNPGDSGLQTSIDYELPAGATAGEIQWPTPTRIVMGPVTNYGYSDEVTLLTKIKVPRDIQVGSVFAVKAKVNWLVCEEICLPQTVDLAIELPVVLSAENRGQGSQQIEVALASLPLISPWSVDLKYSNELLSLNISDPTFQLTTLKSVWFFPSEWGKVLQSAEQTWRLSGDKLELQFKPGDETLASGENLTGVLAITEDNGNGKVTRGYVVKVTGSAESSIAAINGGESDLVLAYALLLALLGGVILNLMPCVFPVLSIKALSLINQAQQSPRQTRLHGVAYTLGILLSFALLGSVLIVLKAGGAEIGWGFQFQSPVFVLAAAYLMFSVGLSLSGVVSIGGSVAGVGSSLAKRAGYAGSFFTGVLATIVATPCTAPFMGAAIGFALTQSPVPLLAVFLALGFGLALPYLLLSQWPSLQRCLPKPGIWMDRLKQGLAFPMYGAAAWLVWVLAQQAGVNAVAVALGGMLALGFAAWLFEFTKLAGTTAKLTGGSIATASLALALLGGYWGLSELTLANRRSLSNESAQSFEPYSASRLSELRAQGRPVFVNLTAAWCISCLVNEKVALSQQAVLDEFKHSGITYLKGDWTNRDSEITKILSDFGRSGVPLYVFYPAGAGQLSKPVVLPQILTPAIVLQVIENSLSSASLRGNNDL